MRKSLKMIPKCVLVSVCRSWAVDLQCLTRLMMVRQKKTMFALSRSRTTEWKYMNSGVRKKSVQRPEPSLL